MSIEINLNGIDSIELKKVRDFEIGAGAEFVLILEEVDRHKRVEVTFSTDTFYNHFIIHILEKLGVQLSEFMEDARLKHNEILKAMREEKLNGHEEMYKFIRNKYKA